MIPFNFTDPLNRNVFLTADNQVRVRTSGIYRIVYSVTTTATAPGVFLQLALNGFPVTESSIPIVAGLNTNEIFLRLDRDDLLTLTLTGAVTLVSGKNASLLLDIITKDKHDDD